MFFNYKIPESTNKFVDLALLKTRQKARTFKLWFWGLTVFTILFGFLSSIMGTAKLASSRFPDQYKFFVSLFVQDGVDQWPIFVLWIGVGTSILTGLLALFVVRKRWISNAKLANNIALEKKVYDTQAGIYQTASNPDFLLFERVAEILNTNTKLLARWGKRDEK